MNRTPRLVFIHVAHDQTGHWLAVAMIDGTSVRYGGHGADEHSPFEIGSITKGLTGLLLADAVRRGEVRLV